MEHVHLYPQQYTVEVDIDNIHVGETLPNFYDALRNVVADPPQHEGGSWVLKLGKNDLTRKNALFFVTFVSGEKWLTFPHCMKSLYVRGHQVGNGVVQLLEIDKGAPKKSEEMLVKEAITKECLEMHYGQTTFQSVIGDFYPSLQYEAGCSRTHLKFGYRTLKELFNEMMNTPDSKTIAKATMYVSHFIDEALRVKLIERYICQNILADEGKGRAIPESLLLYVHGWGRASLCIAAGICQPSLKVDVEDVMSLEDMKNTYGALMRIHNPPTRIRADIINLTALFQRLNAV